ncbi:hypothetical protein NW757_014655 [Fusarium falciforme]|nr:hypothetical protein NW757_014655 [Fusarium falciforme]
MASWATIFAKILKATTIGANTNAQLPKNLERNSRALESISRSFVERSKDLKMFSYYEKDKMDFLNSLVRNTMLVEADYINSS